MILFAITSRMEKHDRYRWVVGRRDAIQEHIEPIKTHPISSKVGGAWFMGM